MLPITDYKQCLFTLFPRIACARPLLPTTRAPETIKDAPLIHCQHRLKTYPVLLNIWPSSCGRVVQQLWPLSDAASTWIVRNLCQIPRNYPRKWRKTCLPFYDYESASVGTSIAYFGENTLTPEYSNQQSTSKQTNNWQIFIENGVRDLARA